LIKFLKLPLSPLLILIGLCLLDVQHEYPAQLFVQQRLIVQCCRLRFEEEDEHAVIIASRHPPWHRCAHATALNQI
jgi:hypothetical protein